MICKMKLEVIRLFLFSCICTFLVATISSCSEDKLTETETQTLDFQSPNILFIFMDDIGKEWFNFYEGSGIELPALESFANNSIIYNNFYSMGLCAPSRVALLTGQYPYQSGFTGNFTTYGSANWHVDQNYYPSFVSHLQQADYYTSMIGKWTSNNIVRQPKVLDEIGFDEYLVYPGVDPNQPLTQDYHRYNEPYLYSSKTGWAFYEDAFSETIFLDSIKHFYSEHQNEKTFLMYNMILPHAPLTATPLDPGALGRGQKFKAFLKYIDFIVGDITYHLDSLDILENTCIILTSDNGSSQDLETTYLGETVKSTNKGGLTELAVNIPFLVHWPEQNTAGQFRSDVADLTDIFPTMVELSNNTVNEENIDGVSLVNSINGMPHSKPFACSMGTVAMQQNNEGKLVGKYPFTDRVIRSGDFKIYVNRNRVISKFYDVKSDPFETINLLNNSDYSSEFERLNEFLDEMPIVDNEPQYDPI